MPVRDGQRWSAGRGGMPPHSLSTFTSTDNRSMALPLVVSFGGGKGDKWVTGGRGGKSAAAGQIRGVDDRRRLTKSKGACDGQ